MTNKKRIIGVDMGGTSIRAGLIEGDQLLETKSTSNTSQ